MTNELDVLREALNRAPELEIERLPGRIPIFPLPLRAPVSGLYESKLIVRPPIPRPISFPEPIPVFPPRPGPVPLEGAPRLDGDGMADLGLPPLPGITLREELRLDVDGRFPQMVASGKASGPLTLRVNWIANVAAVGPDLYRGAIWYKDGTVSAFPYTTVEIQVTRSWFLNQRAARVTFTGGAPGRIRTFVFKSQYSHPVNIEFDCAEGEVAITTIETHAHPNRPATLPNEQLSIETVFRRAGFDVSTSPGGPVPIAGAGIDAKWSDQEMHDAMQVYWSRFANRPQWALWVFFASLHEIGTNLGGIMFDDIGPNHRQGTAIFNDSFIATPPATEPVADRQAWVRRMIFWTACHEMGHAFNLAHSWQKELGTGWIPLTNEPEERSFMNYPFRVSGGQSAFFANFPFRFSDPELLFMRHAPERFVQMGNADWFDHHGFREADVLQEPTFRLEVRLNRERSKFEFLEPAVVELKLTNASSQIQLVDERVLANLESMTVIVKRNGQPARRYAPLNHYCFQAKARALSAGESLYDSLFLGAGLGGWYIAEPGKYTIQLALHLPGEDIVSNVLDLTVLPPRGYDEEVVAQDYFSEEVGRILALDGSRFLTAGNEVLREVVARLSDRKAAIHAKVALGQVLRSQYKEFVPNEAAERHFSIEIRPSDEKEADQLLRTALVGESAIAVESLGHVDYKGYMDQLSDWLADRGELIRAAEVQDALKTTLESRRVRGRPVLESVLKEVDARRASYVERKAGGSSRSKR